MGTSHPELALIVALSENRVIANEGKMPWYLPEDLRRFRALTTGHAVVMGRKTWETLGKPLPNRKNVVLTSRALDVPEGVLVFDDVDEALSALSDEEIIWIMGGGQIYELMLDRVDRWELTIVEGQFAGDTFFPEYQHLIDKRFELANVERRKGYRFETYRRKNDATSQ